MLSIPSLLGGGWYLLSFISMFILNMEVPKRGTLYFVCVKTKKKNPIKRGTSGHLFVQNKKQQLILEIQLIKVFSLLINFVGPKSKPIQLSHVVPLKSLRKQLERIAESF